MLIPEVRLADHDSGITLSIAFEGEPVRPFRIADMTAQSFRHFWAEAASELGLRSLDESAPFAGGSAPPWTPLLTDNLHPRILCGYGDPAVLRTADGWWLTATSNDAPDAFPLLHSADSRSWSFRGFVFADGAEPGWTAKGRGIGDFWAPEMARVGEEYWLTYTARSRAGGLSIGLARAPHPTGPWRDNGAPLLGPAMIDSHLHVEDSGRPWLIWKKDSNSLWPRPLAAFLRRHTPLIERIFATEGDRRAAALCAALQPFAETRPPMQRFYLMQPLIRTTIAKWQRARAVLSEIPEASAIVADFHTPVFAQRLSAEGQTLIDERHILLVNDLPWEGHLIEGPFVVRHGGLHYLFYAGNDFTSPDYGIGYAVADRLTGPWRKADRPLLASHADWLAPGHASVAPGPDGEPRLFFHAFHPGTGGYNVFRALLSVGLEFDGEVVRLRR